MTYVDAACAPLRKTGQIKIYGPDAFAGMRKAGRLAAECLDMLVAEIKPGETTEHIDRRVYEFGMDNGALPATLMYRGYRKATWLGTFAVSVYSSLGAESLHPLTPLTTMV